MFAGSSFWLELVGNDWSSAEVTLVVVAVLTLVGVFVAQLVLMILHKKSRRLTETLSESSQSAAASEAKRTRRHAKSLAKAAAGRERENNENHDRRFRDFEGRNQWWIRFSWAADKFTSASESDRGIGYLVVRQLINSAWVDDDDRKMTCVLADMIADEVRPTNDA